jgi:hypothetical protein
MVVPLGHPANRWPQATVVVDARANQGQAGMAGVEFVVALLKDESLHIFTCQVSFQDRRILQYFYLDLNKLIATLQQFH